MQGKLLAKEKSCAGDYRYGFNGKEKDDELKGGGNSYDFGARIYDPRLGRWLSTDPLQKKYPGESPYSFAGNSPIVLLDNDGNVKVKCVNIIAADGSTSSITTVDADYIVSKGYGPHLTLKGYDNNYQIDYDVFTTTTIDYSHMKDGKPTITSRAQLKEHSWILEARANLLNKKVIVTKELGDPAGNTDDPLGQFSGNTNPVMSPNAQGISDGKGDETQDWQGGNSEGVRNSDKKKENSYRSSSTDTTVEIKEEGNGLFITRDKKTKEAKDTFLANPDKFDLIKYQNKADNNVKKISDE